MIPNAWKGFDFGLGEVRVGRERRDDVRAEPLGEIDARLKLAIEIGPSARNAAAGRDRGSHHQAAAEIKLRQACDEPGAARLRDADLRARRLANCPAESGGG